MLLVYGVVQSMQCQYGCLQTRWQKQRLSCLGSPPGGRGHAGRRHRPRAELRHRRRRQADAVPQRRGSRFGTTRPSPKPETTSENHLHCTCTHVTGKCQAVNDADGLLSIKLFTWGGRDSGASCLIRSNWMEPSESHLPFFTTEFRMAPQ